MEERAPEPKGASKWSSTWMPYFETVEVLYGSYRCTPFQAADWSWNVPRFETPKAQLASIRVQFSVKGGGFSPTPITGRQHPSAFLVENASVGFDGDGCFYVPGPYFLDGVHRFEPRVVVPYQQGCTINLPSELQAKVTFEYYRQVFTQCY